uniref:Stromal cell derived factor 2 like 1 n=1 Tax=Seriola dumerili TaxID=41447 RepID=A0A3B4U3Y2_SERDU
MTWTVGLSTDLPVTVGIVCVFHSSYRLLSTAYTHTHTHTHSMSDRFQQWTAVCNWMENADDANSYWQIRGKPNRPCQRGASIKCGQAIRITHMKDWPNLHTQHFSLTPEVSAFAREREGYDLDVWTVQCDGVHWGARRNRALQTRGHGRLPERDGRTVRPPIRGQREVHGMSSSNQHNWWRAMERRLHSAQPGAAAP